MSAVPTRAQEPSSTGLDANVAAALAYLFPPVGGVVFFVLEKENRFVRFHAAQAIVVGIAMFAVWIAFFALSAILRVIPILGPLFSGLLWAAIALGGFALWLLLTFRAYLGQEWEVPIAGDYARRLIAAPAGQP
jgi:uncharacterized membrane protein